MALTISRHDTVDVVELSDGTKWRIWPADVPATLRWLPTTELEIVESNHDLCSHVLINREDDSRVRVLAANETWPVQEVRRMLETGKA
jgi:hypothetical protein